MAKGKVYLVGAGPGDPGLITVRGIECLKRAEVVIYDRLINEQLLDAAPETAERIYAGKGRAGHTMTQPEINEMLVEKAITGKTVVRLKGGDPFVLGRGGEEAQALTEHNIPFEIVPGITSAIAVPAYAGIPVTHRGLASSFSVITGHEDPTKENSSIDWEYLSRGTDTLIFLMGVQNLSEIIAKLVKYGRHPETPVAVIENGTRPDQRTVTGSLADIVTRAEEEQVKAPALVVVGDVVKLRDEIRWFDNRPLSGKRVLVTRARQQASALSQLLAEKGALPVELPAIDIQPLEDTGELDRAIAGITQYQWLLFTSVNGVDAFFKRLHTLGLDARTLKGIKIGTIGPATAHVLQERGILPDYTPGDYTTSAIVAGMQNRDIRGQRFLLPRADIADRALVEGLRRLGAEVDDVAVYRTVPATEGIAEARKMLPSGKIDVITFASSSTVTNLVAAFQGEPLDIGKAKVACIGKKTAETAKKAGLRVDILAWEATIPALVAAIEEHFSK
ncbi:MAG: uroporphyrinogen-III C-methyltransferase [Chloroflexi bacterium]|nr:uroporphyrinogen-III C-methyltransferase [Chloroflexota bacterium]